MPLVLAFPERLAVFNRWNDCVESETARPADEYPRIAEGIQRIWNITRQVYPSAELGLPAAQLREFDGYRQGIHIVPASADQARKVSGWRLILDRLAKDTRNLTLRQLVRGDAPLARQFEADWIAPLFERPGFPPGTHFGIWNWLILQTRASHGDADMGLTGHWHFDAHYPCDYFKVMIFLNDTSEHGSGTDFLDAEASRELSSRSGYVGFAPNRLSDLNPLASSNEPMPITEFRPKAGDAAIFWPSRVLHRGIYPRQGVRYALSFSMMPVSEFQTRDQFLQNFRTADAVAVEGQDLPPFYAPD